MLVFQYFTTFTNDILPSPTFLTISKFSSISGKALSKSSARQSFIAEKRETKHCNIFLF